eukprot:UN23679
MTASDSGRSALQTFLTSEIYYSNIIVISKDGYTSCPNDPRVTSVRGAVKSVDSSKRVLLMAEQNLKISYQILIIAAEKTSDNVLKEQSKLKNVWTTKDNNVLEIFETLTRVPRIVVYGRDVEAMKRVIF